jgi:hypothetical protein
MNHDRFIGEYVKSLKDEISKLKSDLAAAKFDSLYDVGRIQGMIAGVQLSLDTIDALYAEQDQ